MFHFNKPIQKRDAFYAALEKPVTVKMAGCTVQTIQSASGGKGHILKVALPMGADSIVHDLERAAKEAVHTHNGEWFANTLTPEEIDAFYRPAATIQAGATVLTALSLFSQAPADITVCGESVASVTELATMDVPSYVATLTLTAQGIFFYPTRFGVRWLVQRIALAKVDDDLEEEVDAHRVDIERFWSTATAKTLARMDEDIRIYESKIDAIRRLQNDLRELLAKAKALPTATHPWNATLEALATQLSVYDTGLQN